MFQRLNSRALLLVQPCCCSCLETPSLKRVRWRRWSQTQENGGQEPPPGVLSQGSRTRSEEFFWLNPGTDDLRLSPVVTGDPTSCQTSTGPEPGASPEAGAPSGELPFRVLTHGARPEPHRAIGNAAEGGICRETKTSAAVLATVALPHVRRRRLQQLASTVIKRRGAKPR